MIPILYASVTEGTVPTNYGVGALSDVLTCEVKEELNGAYELTMEYAAEGIHASEIVPNAILKVKPNYTDDPQLFRIYKVGKTINGRFTVNAQHIIYDLSGKIITSGSSGSCVGACALLEAQAGNFTINTDKTVSASFSVSEPSSVRSWFGGKKGSLLDVFGGEWFYNNYAATLKQARGQDRSVTIRYGKNLVDLSQELDMENLVTGVVPFYKDSQTEAVTTGTKVSTGLVLDVDRDIAVDFSSDVDPESATPIATQLATLAAAYIANHNYTSLSNSITLDFVQLQGLTERIDLGDTCHIYFEALGISSSVRCIATVWDALEERYTSTTFGDVQTNIADTIANNEKEMADKPSVSIMEEAINRATELITGNLGGYIVIHDSNGDGEPDEILIMDTADINTATKVWRWNKNGLGYSSTGYAGTYGLAMTADGQIVADYITTGTLNADLIKAGVIEDAGHHSSIDMTTGIASLNQLTAKGFFSVVDAYGTILAYLSKTANGGYFHIADSNNNMCIFLDTIAAGGRLHISNVSNNASLNLQADAVGGAVLDLDNGNGDTCFHAISDDDGGLVQLRNTNGDLAVQIAITSEGGGVWFLKDSGGTKQIEAIGETGEIYCVLVHQSSSRKIKKNIKPIEDARKILELEAVSFDFKNEKLGTDKRGFIAEDVQKVLPNLVKPETETTPAALDYVGMIPYLQAIIKEHETKIAKLESEIKTIKGA